MQGTLVGLVLKVLRQGTGRQTRYTVVPMGVGDTITKAETDTKTRLAYAGELCKTLDVNAKETYSEWKGDDASRLRGLSQDEIVNEFITYLEARAAQADDTPFDSAAQDNDIATMLDNV